MINSKDIKDIKDIKNVRYTLGLDLGISSIGFAGTNKEEEKILFSGVRIFTAAEEAKTGASLALPRRLARGKRRGNKRLRLRKSAIKNLFQEKKMDISGIGDIFLDPWAIRKEATQRLLTSKELAVALFHIAKKRGFHSNAKQDKEIKDNQIMKKCSQELRNALEQSERETIGAYLADSPKKRNSAGSYTHTISRDLIKEEVCFIFKKQKELGNEFATEDLKKRYEDKAFFQNPIGSSESLVGFCSFYPEEKRICKDTPTAEIFKVWQQFNHLKIIEVDGGERNLRTEEKDILWQKIYKCKSGLKYERVWKELKLDENIRFNMTEKPDKIFVQLRSYHNLGKIFKEDFGMSEEEWKNYYNTERSRSELDHIVRILAFYNDEKEIRDRLGEYKPFTDREMTILIEKTPTFKGCLHLSKKAIDQILPHLEKGDIYSTACEKEALFKKENSEDKKELLPIFEDVRNPVVNRAFAEGRKVLNQIIRKWGTPDKIIIELAREMGKSRADRQSIEKKQEDNRKTNETVDKSLKEFGMTINSSNRWKKKLWDHQQGRCAYSDKPIDIEQLKDSTATEVDHILPFAQTFSDSWNNQVLCLKEENQNKGCRTAMEYLKAIGRDTSILEEKARTLKKNNLLKDRLSDADEKNFKNRNLNDTRYICKIFYKHIKDYLHIQNGVEVRNGSLTNKLRHFWGLGKKDREKHLHHAVDAVIISLSTQRMVQTLAEITQRKNEFGKSYAKKHVENKQNKIQKKPWDTFTEDVRNSISNIFVTHSSVSKRTGPAHKETIYSNKERCVLQNICIKDLNKDNIEDLVGKTKKNKILYRAIKEQLEEHDWDGKKAFPKGIRDPQTNEDIKDVLIRAKDKSIVKRIDIQKLNKSSIEEIVDKERNKKLYRALKEQLEEHNWDGEKAFPKGLKFPGGSDSAPVVKKVRIKETQTSGFELRGGLVHHGRTVRVDVFKNKKKFWLCPIYVHHFSGKNTLPNKCIKQKTSPQDWPEMDDNDFIFSLYKNDLVKFQKNENSEVLWCFYSGVNISSGNASFHKHDDNERYVYGIRNAFCFEKYRVDIWGNKSKVKKEKRIGMEINTCSSEGISSFR